MVLKDILNIFVEIGSKKIECKVNTYIKIDRDAIGLFYNPILNQNINKLNQLIEQGNLIHKSFYTFAIINKLPQVIQWLKEKDCLICEDSINLAVIIGNKDLVYWLLSNNCSWDIYTFSYALESGDINFLSWLLMMGCFWGILTQEHEQMIQSNSKIKKWLKSNDCPWIF
jgi:hypothetical protein